MMAGFYFSLFYLITSVASRISKLDVVYEWSKVNYTSDSVKNFSQYNLFKAVPFDFHKAEDGRVFVTVVAKKEVPISLTTVANSSPSGPLLAPYPDSSWFLDLKNCSNITNVRSITIDKCNRLWALDTGRIGKAQICNASLLVFDLASNLMLNKYEIPRDVTNNREGLGVLLNPVLKFKQASCEVEKIFIADPESCALIVWQDKKFVRLENSDFESDKSSTKFNISGESFKLPGGINAMELEPSGNYLFFSPLASKNLSILYNLIVRDNFDLWDLQTGIIFKTQPTAIRLSVKHNVFFVGQTDNSIACLSFNTIWPSDESNMDVAVKDEKLQYINSMKIYENPQTNEEELWILSTKLQKIISSTIKYDEINYRILKASVKDLIKDKLC